MSAAAIEVSGLSLKLGSFELRDIGLSLGEGEILVVLGKAGDQRAGHTDYAVNAAALTYMDHGKDTCLCRARHKHVWTKSYPNI